MPAISVAMMWVHWTVKRCAKNIKIVQDWRKNDFAIIPLAHGCEVLFEKCAVLIGFSKFKGRRWMLEHEGRVKKLGKNTREAQ